MWQEILITDVTRMGEDKVCVAGINHQGDCIRPLLSYPNTIREHDLYHDDTAMIRPRAVVNMFLEAEPRLNPPHTEDHVWIDSNRIELLRIANDKVWHTALNKLAKPSVVDIFEIELHKNKKVKPGEGSRSLGTIKPTSIDKLGYYQLEFDEIDGKKEQYRLSFTDSAGAKFYQIPVTDLSLRYYLEFLHKRGRLHPAKIRDMMERKLANAEVWLRLGLTRPFQKTDDDEKWCYLQVTGIYTSPDYLEGKCFADFRAEAGKLL